MSIFLISFDYFWTHFSARSARGYKKSARPVPGASTSSFHLYYIFNQNWKKFSACYCLLNFMNDIRSPRWPVRSH